ncbi:hypothetical protein EUBVEN_01975 [Eubacterium ventriosum ATCC 27560]|uniref:Uncharacterized protein n=1 Tax=Eubacterium ventriosum ATCC 27560 TaxID=411463 RepID=A5Z8D4_9FIRM|nr:hypothetical protein EUBVEN_01975 [Eubacterium ventriosum ATCC 27560]
MINIALLRWAPSIIIGGCRGITDPCISANS